MLRSRIWIGGAVALLVIVGAACGGDDDDDSNASAVTTTSTTTADSGSETSGEFDAYIGLTVAEATTKAEDEGRPRVSSKRTASRCRSPWTSTSSG